MRDRDSKTDKRVIAFYPLVVAAFPVLSTFAANPSYVPLDHAVRPLAMTLGGAALLTLLLSWVLRSAARGAAAAAVFVIAFFGFFWFAAHPIPFLGWALPRWAVCTALAMGLAAWKAPAIRPLNVFALCLLAVALSNLGLSVAQMRRLSARSATDDRSASVYTGPKPDVFYIILDAHGREDALQRTMGYDDRAFVDGLRSRGFYVADQSRSNYCQTELSIPSSMNMDYIGNLLPKLSPEESDRSPLPGLLNQSAVERRFRAHGYKFLSVTSGFTPISFPTADAQLDNEHGMSLIEQALYNLTPLASPRLGGTGFTAHDTGAAGSRRRITLSEFEALGKLAPPELKPRFIVAHILAPHPPFVFGPNGEHVTIGKYHGLDDFEFFYENVGDRADYIKGYTGQATFVDKLTLQAIDQLLKAAGPRGRPIIIVQGDHGSRMNASFLSANHTDVTECFQNLDAFLVPDEVRSKLWPDMTPVNSFRVLLDGLFGEGLPLLKEQCLYSNKDNPYRYVNVTPYVQRTVPTSERGERLSFGAVKIASK